MHKSKVLRGGYMNRQEMINEKDMLNGNINRMFVTDNFAELCSMYEYACKRLEKLFNANYDRITVKNKTT